MLVILPVKLLLEILELSTFETNPPIPRSPAITPDEWTLVIVVPLFACFAIVAASSLEETLASFIERSWIVALLKVLNNGFFRLYIA